MASPLSAALFPSDLTQPPNQDTPDPAEARPATPTPDSHTPDKQAEDAHEVQLSPSARMFAMELQGRSVFEIAEAMNMTEAQVIQALGLKPQQTANASPQEEKAAPRIE